MKKDEKMKVTIIHGEACMIRAYMCDTCREAFEKEQYLSAKEIIKKRNLKTKYLDKL